MTIDTNNLIKIMLIISLCKNGIPITTFNVESCEKNCKKFMRW